MKIIALSGKKRSGKDTVYIEACHFFAERDYEDKGYKDHGTAVGRVGFADPLKHEVSEATGFTTSFIEEHKQEFRTLLQVWGTDFRRCFSGSDYWINKMDAIIKKSSEFYDILFVTDLRFKNEADFIKGIGGYVVNVERRVQEDPEDIMDTSHSHVSEKDMDDYGCFDYVLNNDKTEPELRESVGKMLNTLKIIKNAA
jgi:hypothetical protein